MSTGTAPATTSGYRHWGGAKNSMIVMPDAVLEKVVPNIIASAYGSAGERCLAGSVLVAAGEVADLLVGAVKEAAAVMMVGPGYREDSELTPLIRDSHRQKVKEYVDLVEEEGAEVRLDGREPPLKESFFFGPTILDKVRGEMRVAREEIFGPVLSVVRVQTLTRPSSSSTPCLLETPVLHLHRIGACGETLA